jgi:multidrug resistance efflux pump
VDINKEQLYKVALAKLMIDSTLFKQQVISKLEMTNSYDNFVGYKSTLLESELTQKQAQSGASSLDNDFLWSQNALDLRVIDIQQRIKELNQQKTQTVKELENMIRSVNYLREQIKKQFIIAETDGQVQNLFNVKFSQNFVAKDQLLLSIVPAQDKFYARVIVPQRDMRYIKIGQRAHLKVEAYNFFTKGILVGRVAYIPESKPKEDFFVNVELPDKTSFDLKAGYTLRGEIIIERMKLYQFIVKKLFRKLETQAPPTQPVAHS